MARAWDYILYGSLCSLRPVMSVISRVSRAHKAEIVWWCN